MVAPILDLLHELHRDAEGELQLETLDVSTTSIDPIALCPYHESPEIWRTLKKKINFAIGLKIPNGQERTVQKGTYRSPHPHRSWEQVLISRQAGLIIHPFFWKSRRRMFQMTL
jgi:hypothetical protein